MGEISNCMSPVGDDTYGETTFDCCRTSHLTDLLVVLWWWSPGKKVMDVAVGSTHCMTLTEDGEVHSWGSNDKMQHFDTLFSTKKQPKALAGFNSKHIVGISCGPGQVGTVYGLTDLIDWPHMHTYTHTHIHTHISQCWCVQQAVRRID